MEKNLKDSEGFEKVEGLENGRNEWGDYPIDTILIRQDVRTVFDTMRRIEKGQVIMDPDFQRDFVWDDVKQSRLIESCLMRIPLPVFYLAERKEDGKIIVVDGLQRLSTFKRFLDNNLKLKGFDKKRKEFDGEYFKGLSSKFQARIEDTNIILYVIDSKVPERIRLDIFERVNSGVPLSRQQMRNALYNGRGTKLLAKLAKEKYFIAITDGSLNSKIMRDRELINRFCAFFLFGFKSYDENYKGDMEEFLSDVLIKMNKMNDEELASLEDKFLLSIRNLDILFGNNSYRKQRSDHTGRRSVINAALFDLLTTYMTQFDNDFVSKNKIKFIEKFDLLLDDSNFWDSITISTNSVTNVIKRFHIFENTYSELLNDN